MHPYLTVTGVDGFVGRHLAQLAAERDMSVFGISLAAEPDAELAQHLAGYASVDQRVAWPTGLPSNGPIVHLAGLAAVGPSFGDPQGYISGNSAMVTHMCEAVLASDGMRRRIVGVSTGAVYVPDSDKMPCTESTSIGFTSPYVVSKVLVENQLTYYRRRGLDTVVARPFNHIGPKQGLGFIVPDLISRLRGLAAGEPLPVGNLSTQRDYTDVRDVAQAYLALAFAPALNHSVYNIASGKARSGQEILDEVCIALGLQKPPLRVEESWIRATDPNIIEGDPRRITEELGWRPEIGFAESIRDAVAA